MPETALERLRRLAGLPAAQDATVVKPPARLPRVVRPLPEPKQPLSDAEETKQVYGGMWKRQQRLATAEPPISNAQHLMQLGVAPPEDELHTREQQEVLKQPQHPFAAAQAVNDAGGRVITPPNKDEEFQNREEFDTPAEAQSRVVGGLAERAGRKAAYSEGQTKADLLSLSTRLNREASILNKRPTVAGLMASSAADMATMGFAGYAGLDRTRQFEEEKAIADQSGQNVTPEELRSSGLIDPANSITPRTLGTDVNSKMRGPAAMIGSMAGLAVPLMGERALVRGALRSPLGAQGFSRLGAAERGLAREARYVNPQTLGGKMVREAGEFAVPGAITDVNAARQNDTDPLAAAGEGLLANAAFGAAFPLAGDMLHGLPKPPLERLRALAGQGVEAVTRGRVEAPGLIPEPAQPSALDRLRVLAQPATNVGKKALALDKRVSEIPAVKKAVAAGVGAYALSQNKDEEGKLPAAALAVGMLATHGEGEGRLLKPDEKPIFYSRLDRHVEKKALEVKNPKPVEFWQNFFKRGGDFAPKEVEMRLGEQLDVAKEQGRQLTGADIKTMLEDNPIKVTAHLMGPAFRSPRNPEIARMSDEDVTLGYEDARNEWLQARGLTENDTWPSTNEIRRDPLAQRWVELSDELARRQGWSNMLSKRPEGEEGMPKGYSHFSTGARYESDYTEPGGTDYRTIVLQANPTKRYKNQGPLDLPAGFRLVDMGEEFRPYRYRVISDVGVAHAEGLTPERTVRAFRMDRAMRPEGQEAPYDEPHWGTNNDQIMNAIGHVRVKTRQVEGKKTLFVEEAQSQAGQEKAKWGTTKQRRVRMDELKRLQDEEIAKARSIQVQINTLTAQVNDPAFASQRKALAAAKKQLQADLDESNVQYAMLRTEYGDLQAARHIPENLPLTDTMGEYSDVMLRTILDLAAREGHEKIVWATGEQQTKRYASALQKVTDHIVYDRAKKKLVALKDGDVVQEVGDVSPARVEEYIGKSAASDLLSTKPRKWRDMMAHQIKGDGITFNSPGMVNYYNEVIPNWFKKEARKLGVQIEVRPHEVPETATEFEPAPDLTIGRKKREPLQTWEIREKLEAIENDAVVAAQQAGADSPSGRLANVLAGAATKLLDVISGARDDATDAGLSGRAYRQFVEDKVREAFHGNLTEQERVLLDNTNNFDNNFHGFYNATREGPLDFSIDDVHEQYNNVRYRLQQARDNHWWIPPEEYRQQRALQKLRQIMADGDDFQTATQKMTAAERGYIAEVMPGAEVYSPSGETTRQKIPVNMGFDVPPELVKRIFEGQALYSNPMLDPQLISKLFAAHPTIKTGLGLAGTGYATKELGEATDNERLKWSGMGIMSLGALHALGAHPVRGGEPFYKFAARTAGKKVVEGMQHETFGGIKGRDILNWISYDILATPDLKEAANEFERGIAKSEARAAEFEAKMRNLGPIGERYATDLITAENWEKEAAKLTPEELKKTVAAAEALKDEFSQAGSAEVAAGTLAPGQYAKYDRQYVPYLYATHEADAAAGTGAGPQPTAKPKIQGHRTREDLPRNVRENLGQIRESGYLASRGVAKAWRNVAAAKMFSALSMMPGALHPEYEKAVRALMAATQASDDAAIELAAKRLEYVKDAARGGYERGQLAGYKTLSNSKGYGVLSGAVVRRDIADYLEGLPHFGTKNLANDLFQSWKKIHTVFNPGTHIGNFVSNITTVHMKGLPIHEQPKALLDAAREIKAYGQYARALTEAGVMDKNMATADYAGNLLPTARSRKVKLRELSTRTTPETRQVLYQRDIDPYGAQPGQSLTHAMGAETAQLGRQTSNRLAKWYNWEDNVFRVALLKKVLKPEAQGGLGLNMPQGIEYVRYHMGDFRTRSKALALTRWVSPFVMYPAKMLPHMVGSIIEHPWRWITLSAGWGFADQLGAYMAGQGPLGNIKQRIASGEIDPMDMQEDQTPSRGFGYLIPGPIQVPFPSRNAKFAFDYSRWTPFSALSGQPSPGSMAAAMSTRWPALLNPGGPLSDIVARTQVNADPYTGEKWIDEADSPAKKFTKSVGGLVANQVLPSALAWHAPRFFGDLADKQYGKAGLDALGFAGARPRTVIPNQRLQQDVYWLQDEREAAKRELNRRYRATSDPDRRQQARDEYLDKIERITREFKRRNTRPE